MTAMRMCRRRVLALLGGGRRGRDLDSRIRGTERLPTGGESSTGSLSPSMCRR